MTSLWRRIPMVLGSIPLLFGCAPKRVHILPEVAGISRVAVFDPNNLAGAPTPESEIFTNEFVSLGFSVLERGHLKEVLAQAFTDHGYLDEATIAKFGRGLGIEAIVLHRLNPMKSLDQDNDRYEVSGWIRMVDVETGKIIMTYNVEVNVAGSGSQHRAARIYAEQVVDDIRMALKQQGIIPGSGKKTVVREKVEVQKTQVKP